jgi:glucose-1-phosphate cytidylyltransferase
VGSPHAEAERGRRVERGAHVVKVVILAGGVGSRLAELTEIVPKPMVQVGGHPILWHIMKHYACFGHTEFIVALGYKGHVIKEYFANYRLFNGSMTVNLRTGAMTLHEDADGREDWTVHLVDTGEQSNTGARLARLERWLSDAPFMLTYGDGVSSVSLDSLLDTHQRTGRVATVTAVRPPSRFGGLTFEGSRAVAFVEKPQIGEGWINGGFMVFNPGVFRYITPATTSLEHHILERLAADDQLAVHAHEGFWQCMDTLRDRNLLEELWARGEARWKLWT